MSLTAPEREITLVPDDYVSPEWTLERLIHCARDERACLEHYWEQGALLSADEQRQLGRALEQIQPAKVNGRPCEPDFEMKPRHWKRIEERVEKETGNSDSGRSFVAAAKRAARPRLCACGCETEFVPASGRQKYANPSHAQWSRDQARIG